MLFIIVSALQNPAYTLISSPLVSISILSLRERLIKTCCPIRYFVFYLQARFTSLTRLVNYNSSQASDPTHYLLPVFFMIYRFSISTYHPLCSKEINLHIRRIHHTYSSLCPSLCSHFLHSTGYRSHPHPSHPSPRPYQTLSSVCRKDFG